MHLIHFFKIHTTELNIHNYYHSRYQIRIHCHQHRMITLHLAIRNEVSPRLTFNSRDRTLVFQWIIRQIVRWISSQRAIRTISRIHPMRTFTRVRIVRMQQRIKHRRINLRVLDKVITVPIIQIHKYVCS